MASIKKYNATNKEWETISSTAANGIYTNSEVLAERGDNVESILESIESDINTIKGNITWLAKYGGGGSGSGGGGTAASGVIYVNRKASDDTDRSITLSETGLDIVVDCSVSSYRFAISVSYGGTVIKTASSATSMSVTYAELIKAGVTSTSSLVVTAYHQASLTTFNWRGTLVVASITLTGQDSYSTTWENKDTYSITLTSKVSISSAYRIDVYGKHIESTPTGKQTKDWGPIVISEGAQYYAGTSNYFDIKLADLVDEDGNTLLVAGNNTITVWFTQCDNVTLTNSFTFSLVLQASDPVFVCDDLSTFEENPTIYQLYQSTAAITFPVTIFFAGESTFQYKIEVDDATTSAYLQYAYKWNTQFYATISIPNAELRVYKLTMWIKDASSNKEYTESWYIKLNEPASNILTNTQEVYKIVDFWAANGTITDGTWQSSTKAGGAHTMTIHNSNSRSKDITEITDDSRYLRLQNACFGQIDFTTSDINTKLTAGSETSFTIEICYKCDYHPDDERIIFQWADLNPETASKELQNLPARGILIRDHDLYIANEKILTLEDEELINVAICYKTNSAGSTGTAFVYVDGVIEAVKESLDKDKIMPNLYPNFYIGAGRGRVNATASNDKDIQYTDMYFYRLCVYNNCISPYDILFDYLNNEAYCHLNGSEPNTRYIQDGLKRNFITVDGDGNPNSSKLYDINTVAEGTPLEFDITSTTTELISYFPVNSFVVDNGDSGAALNSETLQNASIPLPILFIDVSSSSSWTWDGFIAPASGSGLPEITGTAQYYDQATKDEIIDLGSVNISQQGTSTLADYIKNLNITFPDGTLFSPKDTWFPEQVYTLKADIVDSSHSLNTSIGKFVNQELGLDSVNDSIYPYSEIVRSKFVNSFKNDGYGTGVCKNCFPNATLKHGVEGFPVFLIMRFNRGSEASTPIKSLGIYQFILGRKSPRNLGYEIVKSLKDGNGNTPTITSSDYPLFKTNLTLTTETINGYWIEFTENYGFDNDTNFQAASDSNVKDLTLTGTFWQTSGSFYDETAEIKFSSLGTAAKNNPSEVSEFMTFVNNIQQLPFIYKHYSLRGSGILTTSTSSSGAAYNGYDYTLVTTESGTQEYKWVKGTDKQTTPNGDGLLDIAKQLNLSSYALYFVLMMFFGLIDNFQKNMPVKIYYNNSGAAEIPLIGIYDTDTGIGQNNQGEVNISEDMWLCGLTNSGYDMIEVNPQSASNSTVVATSNKLWLSLDHSDVKYVLGYNRSGSLYSTAWYNLLTAMKSKHEGVITDPETLAEYYYQNYFLPQTEGCGELLFNLTYIAKYITKYQASASSTSETNQINKLHGRRRYQVRRWLKKHAVFLNSMFAGLTTAVDGTEITNDTVAINGALAPSMDFKTNTPVIMAVKNQGSSLSYVYVPKNTPTAVYWGASGDSMDTSDYAKSHTVSNFMSIIDFGALNDETESDYPLYYRGYNTINTGSLPYLTQFNVSAPTRSSSNMNGLAAIATDFMKSHFTYNGLSELRIIDFRNTYPVNDNTYSLDLESGFEKLQKLYINNSCITSLKFPDGVSLMDFDVSNSNLHNLSIDSQNFITSVDITGCSLLTSLDVTNCDNVKTISIDSTNANLATVTASQLQSLSSFKCVDNDTITTVSITACNNIEDIYINNCKYLKYITVTGKSLKSIVINNCENFEYINIVGETGDIYSNVTTVNLASTHTVAIGYNQTYDEYLALPDDDKIIDLTRFTNLTTFNCFADPSVMYVKFRNINGSPFVLTNSFQGCTNLIRIYGNVKINYVNTSTYGNGMFRGCSKFSIHGAIDLSSTSTISSCGVTWKGVSVVDFREIIPGVKRAFKHPYEIISGSYEPNTSWDNYTVSDLFQETTSANDGRVTNFELTNGNSSLFSYMFYGTSTTTFDVYYILALIGVSNLTNNLTFSYTFTNNSQNLFSWKVDNNPNRYMFYRCIKVTNFSRFVTATLHYAVSPENNTDNGLFSPLKNLSYLYEWGGTRIMSKDFFKRYDGNTYSSLTSIYFFYTGYILDSDTLTDSSGNNIITYDNYSNNTWMKNPLYIIHTGSFAGMFDYLPNISVLYSVFNASTIQYDTIKLPSTITEMCDVFNTSNGCNDMIYSDIFKVNTATNRSSLKTIVNSFVCSSIGYWSSTSYAKSNFYIYEDMFAITPSLQYWGYIPNNSSWGTYTNGAFYGNGVNKTVVVSPDDLTTTPDFPYEIFNNTVNLITCCRFFEDLTNTSFRSTVTLPGNLFEKTTKLKTASMVFQNVNFTFSLTSNGFINCSSLENVYHLFYHSLSASNRSKLYGCIPYRLFYHGATTNKSGTYDGRKLTDWQAHDYTGWVSEQAIIENLPTAEGTILSGTDFKTGIDWTVTARLITTESGDYVWHYYFNSGSSSAVEVYRNTNNGTLWYDSTVAYDPLTTVTGTEEKHASTPNEDEFFNSTSGSTEDAAGVNHGYTVVTNICKYSSPYQTINNMEGCFYGCVNLEPFDEVIDPTVDEYKDYNPAYKRPTADNGNTCTYILSGSSWNENVQQEINNKKLLGYWMYNGNPDEISTSDDVYYLESSSIESVTPSLFGSISKTEALYYMCAPDLLRYCSNDANTNVTNLFANCGLNYTESHGGTIASGENYFSTGISGRIVPYMLYNLSNLTSIRGMFYMCRRLYSYKYNNGIYQIPDTFFSVAKKVSNLSNAFAGLAFEPGTLLGNVFGNLSASSQLDIRNIFCICLYAAPDSVNLTKTTLSGLFNNKYISKCSGAFSTTDLNLTTGTGYISRVSIYANVTNDSTRVSFVNNFTSNKLKDTVNIYYVYYGYAYGTSTSDQVYDTAIPNSHDNYGNAS